MVGNRPIRRFRAGPVTCALWENERVVNGKPMTTLSVSISRIYKDSQGAWKNTNSLGRNEIPLAKWCLDRAFDAMLGERTLSPPERVHESQAGKIADDPSEQVIEEVVA